MTLAIRMASRASRVMVGFERQLEEAARWDLAFYVGSLGFAADEIARGKALLDERGAAALARVPDLATLTHESAAALAGSDRDLAVRHWCTITATHHNSSASGRTSAPIDPFRRHRIWDARSST